MSDAAGAARFAHRLAGSTPAVVDGVAAIARGEVLLEPGHHPGERLALLTAEAATQFGAQHLVDVGDLLGECPRRPG